MKKLLGDRDHTLRGKFAGNGRRRPGPAGAARGRPFKLPICEPAAGSMRGKWGTHAPTRIYSCLSTIA